MRRTLLVLLVALLPLLSGAQSLVPKRSGSFGLGADSLMSKNVVHRRWKMLDDSTVAVPLRDLQQTAVIRWTVDELREKARTDVRSLMYENSRLRSALEERDYRARAYERVSSDLNQSLIQVRSERDTARNKADRLRPWATVGKVGTVVLGLAVVGGTVAVVAASVR